MADFSAWEAYLPITVQDDSVPANLTDFPTLVRVAPGIDAVVSAAIGARAEADGDDIRFSLSDGTTELDFELLTFSIAAGNATGIWRAKTPSIAASGGASLRLYYGNGAVGSGEDQNNTWNSNFTASYRMEDATTSTIGDSTSNGYTGTKAGVNAPPEASGKIWKSQDFDGANDTIDLNQSIATLMSTSVGMVSCWVKCKGTAPPVSNSYTGDNVWGNTSGSRWLGVSRGIIGGLDRLWAWNWDGSEDRIPITYSVNTWHHIAWIHTGGTLYAYKDGSLVSSTASGNTGNSAQNIFIGAAEAQQRLEGEIEDVQFLDTIPTNVAAWIEFQHANDNSADNELTWGSEVVQGYTVPLQLILETSA